MKHFLFFPIFLSLLLASCTCDVCTPESVLMVTPPSADFAAAGETKNFTVHSNMSWRVDSQPSWCRLTPLQGSGGSVILSVTAIENTATPRDSVISLMAANGDKQQIQVSQEGATVYLIQLPSNFSSTWAYHIYYGNQKVAEVCQEYVKGFSETIPAITIYGAPAGIRANTGFISNGGGQVLWNPAVSTGDPGFCTYTPPAAPETYTMLYYKPATGEISPESLPGGTTLSSTYTAASFSDWEGNVYGIAKIGLLYWTTSNLKAITYSNGMSIPTNLDQTAWTTATSGACCVYDHSDAQAAKTALNAYYQTYGVLYNGFAVSGNKLDYTGWRVPTADEINKLALYVYNANTGGAYLKEAGNAHWTSSPGISATNLTGFTALPGGRRDYFDAQFIATTANGYFWSASDNGNGPAYRYLSSYNNTFQEGFPNPDFARNGYSVRLVSDTL